MINMSPRKNILLIATGGTIASKKSDNGLKPQISPEELMQYIPQVKDICDFHPLSDFLDAIVPPVAMSKMFFLSDMLHFSHFH